MYIPTTSILHPAAEATTSVVARQFSGLTPPYENNGNPFDHDPTGRVTTPGSTDWYGAVWVVPVAWALTFYCVVSLLLLCTLYGQGIVDGKLNVSVHLPLPSPLFPLTKQVLMSGCSTYLATSVRDIELFLPETLCTSREASSLPAPSLRPIPAPS